MRSLRALEMQEEELFVIWEIFAALEMQEEELLVIWEALEDVGGGTLVIWEIFAALECRRRNSR